MTNDVYDPARIRREDVQTLLRQVDVEEDPAFSREFEDGFTPARVRVTLDDGTVHEAERETFEGHPTRPMSWEAIEAKFHTMTEERYDETHREEIVRTVRNVEEYDVVDLVALLT